jgi:arginase family enzyme
VAFDVDVLDPTELAVFMPEPGGPSLEEAERILAAVASRTNVVGAGLTGAAFDSADVEPLSGLGRALGL